MEIPQHQLVAGATKCSICDKYVVAHPLHPTFSYLYLMCNGELYRVGKPADYKRKAA